MAIIQGRVLDADTKKLLEGVNIFVNGDEFKNATDVTGFFNLDVSEGEKTLVFEKDGYRNADREVNAVEGEVKELDVALYYKYEDLLVRPSEVRNRWCFGLPLHSADTGDIMPDSDIAIYIRAAEREVERRLGVFLNPRKIVCNPDLREDIGEEDYDLFEYPYDYDFRAYRQWGFLQLRQYPIISVERVSLVLPNYREVVTFHEDWVKVNHKVGQIRIVPYAGSPTVMTMAGMAGTAYPILMGQFGRDIPQAFWIDYTAGLPEVDQSLRNIIAKLAAIDVLGIAGDAILAGIASVGTSVDGLSENFSTTASATNATYGARILQLRGEVRDFFSESGGKGGERGGGSGGARTYYKGFVMKVI